MLLLACNSSQDIVAYWLTKAQLVLKTLVYGVIAGQPACATVFSWVGGPRDAVKLLLFSPVLDWLELAES